MDATALIIITIASSLLVFLVVVGLLILRLASCVIGSTINYISDRRWRGNRVYRMTPDQLSHAKALGAQFVGPEGDYFKVCDGKLFQHIRGDWSEKTSVVIHGRVTII